MRAGKIFITDLQELGILDKVRISAPHLNHVRMHMFRQVKTVKIVL